MEPSRFERRMKKLQCNNCGNQFEDLAWHVAIRSHERGVIGWNIHSYDDIECPSCRSTLIGPQR